MAVNNSTNDKAERWYFTKEQLENTPSRKAGYDSFKELSYRQQAANFIQDMGQRLKVSQLCINTAIVYMHRFYVFHSFTHFPWHQMAAAALFLAAKVEEQPRKLEYVIRIANICRSAKDTSIDVNSERYLAQSQDLVFNENVLLQTLGFDVAIDHPHTHVVRCCHLVRASKDLAQTSYFMASNSLHLTTMCLQYKPTVVACFCIHVACKWSNWEIPLSNEDKEWFSYVDPTVTAELLQQLTKEFLVIFESCPSRLKEKIAAIADNTLSHSVAPINSPFDTDPRKITPVDQRDSHSHRSHEVEGDPHKHRSSRPHDSSSSSQQQREREYREKKERERLAMQHGAKPPMPGSQSSSSKPNVPHGHHRAPMDPKFKQHSRPPVVPYPPTSRAEPRDILREAAKVSPFGIASKEYKERDHKDPNVRSDKEVQKRDYLLKPNVTEMNNLNNYPDIRVGYSGDRLRVDSNRPQRPPSEPNKLPYKHDSSRRHEEPKAYLKSETDNIKKHLSSVHDKNSAYLIKPSNSTSQKVKSPFSTDTSKSVPKSSSSHHSVKSHQQNGTGNGNVYGLPYADVKVKSEPVIKEEPHVKEERTIKEEHPIKEEYRPDQEKISFEEPKLHLKEEKVETYQPPVVKRQSLFSPEKSPSPQLQCSSSKSEMKLSIKKPVDMTSPTVPVPSALSPLESPGGDRRTRAYSSSSEPELRPVMKKIDQVEGFENLMRDSTIGINKLNKIPDIITTKEQLNQYVTETKPLNSSVSSDSGIGSQVLINGIETNPTLISNLLKDAPPVIATIGANTSVVSTSLTQPNETIAVSKEKDKEHHHHKSKKKNKEKHKHKDKDRNREEKEKKKKHKDKDREKHKHKDKHEVPPQPIITEPIKIKIQMDKIQPIQPPAETLKIRIPKDKIKTDGIGMPSYPAVPTGGLKLKIPKEVINNCSIANDCSSGSSSSSSSSRKRDRDRSSPGEAPPTKMSKSAYRDSKQNGRHSYNKVSNQPNLNTVRPPRFPPNNMQHLPPPRQMLRQPRPLLPPPGGPAPHMRPLRPPRNPLYFFPPPNQIQRLPGPPPNMPPPMNMPNVNVPPPNFMYPAYYTPYNMYMNPDIYQALPVPATTNPPLPTEAPPDVPPPPPPPPE